MQARLSDTGKEVKSVGNNAIYVCIYIYNIDDDVEPVQVWVQDVNNYETQDSFDQE